MMGAWFPPIIAGGKLPKGASPEGRRWFLRICLGMLLPLAFGLSVVEARTPSGTRIVNTVTAGWSNTAGIPYSASASVTNTVSDRIAFSVTSVTGRALVGSATAFPFILANTNNFSDRFRLRVVSSTWTQVGVTVHHDANGNGLADPGEGPIGDSPPFGEGAVARFLLLCDVPASFPPGRTNIMVLEVSSFRTNTMVNSRILVTNRIVTAVWSNAVLAVSASDRVKTLLNLDGSGTLGDEDIRIVVRLGRPPADPSTVRVWFSTGADPDGPYGPNPADRSVPLVFDGSEWVAVIPASDPAIRDGETVRFVVVADHAVYTPDGSSSWKFRVRARPDQGRGFQVFPTVFDLREGGAVRMLYRVSERSRVTISVYDLKGELVRTFDEGVKDPGAYGPVEWDGRNHSGREVAAGLYFVRIRAKGLDETRKVVVVK